jgi:glycosyltransferase involved in cell wall biosynthesis
MYIVINYKFKMISVTFLIPVYNEVKTLENAILEVLELDYPKKEIIIIDNNSVDGSKQILEKFINNNNLKIIFKDKNLGYGDTIKKGFALAKGEVMYIQYSDSEYSIDGFFLMIEKYNKTRADIIFGERYPKFSFIQKIKESIKRPQYLGTFLTTSLINNLYNVNLNDIIGSKMYKTFTFKKFQIDRNNNGFDFELVSRIMKKKLNIDKILVPYKSRKNSSDKKIKFYHMFYALYEILRIKFFT